MSPENQDHRDEPDKAPNDPEQPTNAPEQTHGGFAEGEENPAAYPADEKVGRFSEGQEQLPEESIDRGNFSDGVGVEPEVREPDEGYAEGQAEE